MDYFKEEISSSGKPYYRNKITNETQWGFKTYYNTKKALPKGYVRLNLNGKPFYKYVDNKKVLSNSYAYSPRELEETNQSDATLRYATETTVPSSSIRSAREIPDLRDVFRHQIAGLRYNEKEPDILMPLGREPAFEVNPKVQRKLIEDTNKFEKESNFMIRKDIFRRTLEEERKRILDDAQEIKFLQEQLKVAQEEITRNKKVREQELNMILAQYMQDIDLVIRETGDCSSAIRRSYGYDGGNYKTVNLLIEDLLAKDTKRVVSGQPLVGNYKGAVQNDTTIRIMSWNVLARGATTHQEEKHGFTFRNTYKEQMSSKYKQSEHIEQTLGRYLLIKDEIIKNNPDIVLLQEVDNYFFTYILKNLPEYTGYFKLIIPQRGDFSSNFATAIIWKSKIFTINEQETLDSKSYRELYHQETLGFTEEDEAKIFNRKNATYVRLTEIGTQRIISLVSIHLSGDELKTNRLTNAKKNLLTFALKFLNKNEGDHRVLGGDMNCPMLISAIDSRCTLE